VNEESEFTPEDWKVFCEYGRTMYSVHLFEKSLLASLNFDTELDEKLPQAELDKRITKLVRMTAGNLKNKLKEQGNIPTDLIEEITRAVKLRNQLAHHYFWHYYIYKEVSEPILKYQNRPENLRKMRKRFEDLNSQLMPWIADERDRKRKET
jgi:hypothetical protein